MVAFTALGMIVGIALAQFFRVFALVPVTIFIVVGACLLDLLGGHTIPHTIMACLSIASSLQVGYFSVVYFSGFVFRARQRMPGVIVQEDQRLLSVAQQEVDSALPALKGMLAAMKESPKAEKPQEIAAVRATKAMR
jgi:hypothetical protein